MLITRILLTSFSFFFFFFNDTATTEIYTLSLHDALPICSTRPAVPARMPNNRENRRPMLVPPPATSSSDRKSTRLNSSHSQISYAVFCLKKKKKTKKIKNTTHEHNEIVKHRYRSMRATMI